MGETETVKIVEGNKEFARVYIDPFLNVNGELRYRCEVNLATDGEGDLHELLRNKNRELLGRELTSNWGVYERGWRVRECTLSTEQEVNELIEEIVSTLRDTVKQNKEKLAGAVNKTVIIYF